MTKICPYCDGGRERRAGRVFAIPAAIPASHTGGPLQKALLEIADALRALALTGLEFTEGAFDRERYERLCALAAQLAGLAADRHPAEMERLYRVDRGYVTPKLDVRTAVFRENHVLLVRERADGLWSLPGGYVDIGDTPTEAAARETLEEAGVETRILRLAGIFDRRLQPEAPPHPFHIVKLVFTGELRAADAEPRGGSETSDARFHPLDRLPALSTGRTSPAHIEAALRIARDPQAFPHLD